MGKKQTVHDTWTKLQAITKKDNRYTVQAYQFIFEALDYTATNLGKKYYSTKEIDRHVSGQELSEGIRKLALSKFGFMARKVLEHWGITESRDFGEIVFNLVDNGLMGKTDSDSVADFKELYDFKIEYDDKFEFDGIFDFSHDWNLSWKRD